uniref:Putative peptidyl-trna hydrolase n=1 Tax=Ixodes scapularis TaxID=6945 RepID=A0A4D5RNS4_IXOSC
MAARMWFVCRAARAAAFFPNFVANTPSLSARSYKSAVSLDKIYPDSDLNHVKPVEAPQSTNEVFSGYIPMNRVEVRENNPDNPFRVELRVHLDSAEWIPQSGKDRLKKLAKVYIDADGKLVVSSDKTKKKLVNVADCVDKLRIMVREACKPPPENIPETRFTLRAKAERTAAKRLLVRKDAVKLTS